jgi:sec-independent protein translocase protein TatB
VFGLSFGELVVLLIVAMIVIGPKDLPKVLRKLGYWSAKLRRFAFDVRAQSGIDEAIRSEGLDRDINEIRKLARGELDGVVAATREATRVDPAVSGAGAGAYTPYAAPAPLDDPNAVNIDREREYPREGADGYGALPDTAIVYAGTLPASPLATDAMYLQDDVPAPKPPAEPAKADEERERGVA